MSQKLGLIYLALAALVIGRSALGSSDRVRIETGVVQGKVQDGVVSFKGMDRRSSGNTVRPRLHADPVPG
jgi:hypothetical protein